MTYFKLCQFEFQSVFFVYCFFLQLCDFLEQNFLEDSYDTIKKLGDYNKSLTSITASDTHGSLGEYLFDKHTL